MARLHPRSPPPAPGTSCFLGGIGLVLLGWPVVGMGVEGFGFLNLFGCADQPGLIHKPVRAGVARCACALPLPRWPCRRPHTRHVACRTNIAGISSRSRWGFCATCRFLARLGRKSRRRAPPQRPPTPVPTDMPPPLPGWSARPAVLRRARFAVEPACHTLGTYRARPLQNQATTGAILPCLTRPAAPSSTLRARR